MKKLLFISLLFCSATMWAPTDPADIRKNLQQNIALLREQHKNKQENATRTSHANHRHEQHRQTLSVQSNDGTS